MWYGKAIGWRIYDIRDSLLEWFFRGIDDAPGKIPEREAP